MMATRSLWCTRDAKNESDSTASTRLKASQPFTNPAKLFDSELCCRKEVRVEMKGLDRYQRTIADVLPAYKAELFRKNVHTTKNDQIRFIRNKS
jgi:endonuclease YncB( thermonuclease family)